MGKRAERKARRLQVKNDYITRFITEFLENAGQTGNIPSALKNLEVSIQSYAAAQPAQELELIREAHHELLLEIKKICLAVCASVKAPCPTVSLSVDLPQLKHGK